MKKILAVFGTRPDAIKMCPLVKAIEARDDLSLSVCVSGQHRELLTQVLDVFGVQADYNLDVMEAGQTLEGLTARILEKMQSVLDAVKPDLVLVHGDTTTAFAAALAAYYRKISVGHVEAGLRTYDPLSPFPEEF
ncbi:MAG: UDP-N-acetylglucosamine 2-epimerase, partial [Clostridia bacterium]|nr:UDP-N-acetylglucosamine 2-epimerase [Clostridia bacterium]